MTEYYTCHQFKKLLSYDSLTQERELSAQAGKLVQELDYTSFWYLQLCLMSTR